MNKIRLTNSEIMSEQEMRFFINLVIKSLGSVQKEVNATADDRPGITASGRRPLIAPISGCGFDFASGYILAGDKK